jgi:hypothetical protein
MSDPKVEEMRARQQRLGEDFANPDVTYLLTKLDEAHERIGGMSQQLEQSRRHYLRDLEADREFLQQVADSYGIRTDQITESFLSRQPEERARAEERERALIAGVKEALDAYDPYDESGWNAVAMKDILSRLLRTEEAINDED